MPRFRGLIAAQVVLLAAVGAWLAAEQVRAIDDRENALAPTGAEVSLRSDHAIKSDASEPKRSAASRSKTDPSTTVLKPAAIPFAEPAWISVEPIGLQQAPITGVGLQADGTIPVNDSTISWYRYGASISDTDGAIIMLAHVAYNDEPGQFAHLEALDIGDRIEVGTNDGSTRKFTVNSLDLTEKTDFNGHIHEYVDRDSPGLRLYLITCGGRFDYAARSYSSFHLATAIAV